MAESVFDKPIDTAIQEINDKIGTVPSGETVEGQIDALNSNFTSLNIESVTRVAGWVTTGSTGNIATTYQNDGRTYVLAPLVSGADAVLRTWVSSTNGGWYFTAVNPNTGATINNTQLAIRYLVVTIKSI